MTSHEIQSIIDKEQADCDRAIPQIQAMRAWLPKYVPILSTLPSLRYCYYYPYTASVIMSVRTREDLAKVRALQKGKWEKHEHHGDDPRDGNLRYEGFVEGVHINIRVVELPPSCRIVEEMREVPETVIPAHVETIRKLVCTDPSKSEAQHDKIISIEREPSKKEMEVAF